jgi:LuxR family maltose regulon positive regulatory protein
LDDFHLIQAQAILDLITFLLEHIPPQIHLAILSRTDPPLPLFRLRARDQLVEVRAEQLRFTNEEVAAFLNEIMGFQLSQDDLYAMESRTEGWIAGLQLAALSMQGSQDPHNFVKAFTGSHHYIMDYLTEEALKLQPEPVRTFLLKTSILSSMCASLCDAVLEDGEWRIGNSKKGVETDSQSILEYLEQANLFVVPLDEKRHWYRYHHLFAEMLKMRLEHQCPRELFGLHARASQWLENNEMIPEATQHAMQAGDRARAAQLVEQHGCSMLMRGESFTLLKWVEAVESYTQTHPWLAILKAWAHALTGQFDQVEPALQMAAGLFSDTAGTIEAKIMLGSMAAVRAHVANLNGDARSAIHYAQGALEYLPESNDFSCSLRSVATSILGDASWMEGNLNEARQAYLEAVRISQAAGNLYMSIISNSNLAEVLMERGDLHRAARILSETLDKSSRPDGQKLPLATRIYACLGRISYEWGELEVADRYIRQCIELSRQWGDDNSLARGSLLLARLEQARGNREIARQTLKTAEDLSRAGRLSARQVSGVNSASARFWIAQGQLERAEDCLRLAGMTEECIQGDAVIPPSQESEMPLLLHLWLAQGDYEAVLARSGHLLKKAETAGRTGRLIEILVLQALAWQGRKELPRALAVLERALSLARPEGYVRVFLDEGEPMAKLLHQARWRRVGGGYADELLEKLCVAHPSSAVPIQQLVEPLTARELEVLQFIGAGASNQEIAGALFISIPTVKRHISNIYAKLGAKSRTQAIAIGRELGLSE